MVERTDRTREFKTETTVKKFGQILPQLRENNNWTQKDLAAELGVDRAYISLFERGIKNPSFITMVKLSKVLAVNVSFAVLIYLEPPDCFQRSFETV